MDIDADKWGARVVQAPAWCGARHRRACRWRGMELADARIPQPHGFGPGAANWRHERPGPWRTPLSLEAPMSHRILHRRSFLQSLGQRFGSLAFLAMLAEEPDHQTVFGDVLWALVNSAEFTLNH